MNLAFYNKQEISLKFKLTMNIYKDDFVIVSLLTINRKARYNFNFKISIYNGVT